MSEVTSRDASTILPRCHRRVRAGVVLVVAVGLIGCTPADDGGSSRPSPTGVGSTAPTSSPFVEPAPTSTAAIAGTPSSSAATPTPSSTRKSPARFAAFTRTGAAGSYGADLSTPGDAPAVLRVRAGGKDFTLSTRTADGERIERILRTSGRYRGDVPINLHEGEEVASIRSTSRVNWSMTVMPLTARDGGELVFGFTGRSVSGSGDSVLLPSSALLRADRIRVEYEGEGPFRLVAHGDRRHRLVDAVAPGAANVRLGNPWVLEIRSRGDWTIEAQ